MRIRQSAGDRLSPLEKLSLRKHKSALVPAATPAPARLPPPQHAAGLPSVPVAQSTRKLGPSSSSSSCRTAGTPNGEAHTPALSPPLLPYSPLLSGGNGVGARGAASDREWNLGVEGGKLESTLLLHGVGAGGAGAGAGGAGGAGALLRGGSGSGMAPLPAELLSGSEEQLRARLVAMASLCEQEHAHFLNELGALERQLRQERTAHQGEVELLQGELQGVRSELALAQSEQRLLEVRASASERKRERMPGKKQEQEQGGSTPAREEH